MTLLIPFSRPLLFATAIFLLVCSVPGMPREAVSQEGAVGGPLRERLKQRWLNARQDKQAHRPSSANPAKIDLPGDYTLSFAHDGLERAYLVHVPKSYRAGTPTPMVLAFHGGGGDMRYMATDRYYGLISKAEAEGFVVVFPNGFSKLKSGKFATWNAGTCCAGARDQKVDDVGFIRKVVSDVTGQLNIDRNRIYATGMSNGGMMAYRLACEMADTFRAIAAVAGTDNTTTCHPAVPVSILHIHARNDDHVLFNGGSGQTFRDKSQVSEFVSVPATMTKWVEKNACNPGPQRVLEKPGAYCERYGDCRDGGSVQLCVTETGGHSWPGGNKPRGDEPPSQAISANDVMWDFFSSIPSLGLPALTTK